MLLESAVVVGAAGLAATGLAALARDRARPWAVVGALLLGRGEAQASGAAARAPRADLRFWTIAAASATALTAVAARPDVFRALAAGELAFALLLGLPLTAFAQAALADLLRRRLPGEAAPSTDEAAADHGGADTLGALCDHAAREVRHARAQVADPARVAALDALDEAIAEYAAALDDPASGLAPAQVRARLRGVVTLARSCLVEEAREAARALGVRPDAAPEELDAVFAALARIYDGPTALPGTCPARYEELLAAHACLRGRLTASDGEPLRLTSSGALRRVAA